MNDERCDRDRVTAILTLRDAATPGPWSKDYYYVVGQVPGGRPGGEVIGQMTPSVAGIVSRAQQEANAAYVAAVCNAFPDVAAALLEALDTIDRLEGEKEKLETLVLCVDSELAQTTIAIPGTYGMLTRAARRIRQRIISDGSYPP